MPKSFWHSCKPAKVFAFPFLICFFVVVGGTLAQTGSPTRLSDSEVRERVDALIKQMTLEEKIDQLS